MTDELQPCPFCGGSAKVIYDLDAEGYTGYEWGYGVKCRDCGAMMVDQDYKRQSLENWNNRYNEDNGEEMLHVEVSQSNLSVRSKTLLEAAGIKDLSELDGAKQEDLIKREGLGRKSVDEIISECEKYGVFLPRKSSPRDINTNLDALSKNMALLTLCQSLKANGIKDLRELENYPVKKLFTLKGLDRTKLATLYQVCGTYNIVIGSKVYLNYLKPQPSK